VLYLQVQDCCGSDDGDFFSTCKLRRETLQNIGQCDAQQCCGIMPVINRWRRHPLVGLSDGVPQARYGHTSNVIGTPLPLKTVGKSSLAYRMMVFGGSGEGRMLDDLWELSLEEHQSVDLFGEYQLRCQAESGAFQLSISGVIVTPLSTTSPTTSTTTTLLTPFINATATIPELREALESVNGIAVEKIRIAVGASLVDSSRICGTTASVSTATVTTLRLRLLNDFTNTNAKAKAKNRYTASSTLNVHYATTELAYQRTSGYVAVRTTSAMTHNRTRYVWSRPDRAVPTSMRPSRRVHHTTTTLRDHTRHNLERIVVFGGWNGSSILNDVWVYAPSVMWGGAGKWTAIRSSTGKYLEVKPNLLLQTIELFGFNENYVAETNMPKRYMHSAVAISTGYTRTGAAADEEIKEPRESLVIYGGVGETGIALGNDWNIYGLPWGGKDPDLFALCLDQENDRYCMRARNLAQ